MAKSFSPSELKAILYSKRANIYYLEKCRVMQKDGRVLYLSEGKKENQFWNIPIANTTVILLGTGTSITQAAMRLLAMAGVLVGFCGGGGTPLFSGTEIEWMSPQSEYRPTQYVQGWLSFWFDEEKRLLAAKKLQNARCDYLERIWNKDRELQQQGFFADDLEIEGALSGFRKKIQGAHNVIELLSGEAGFAKQLYKYAARKTDTENFVRDAAAGDEAGMVPVNTTKKNIQHEEWESSWLYLPQIKALAAMAGLLHDWGKACDSFQRKLRAKSEGIDPFRHEWLSCRLIIALIEASGDKVSDDAWLQSLADWSFDEKEIARLAAKQVNEKLGQLPPIAGLLCWLILSHHHLPSLMENERNGFSNEEKDSFQAVIRMLNADWGYKKSSGNEKTAFSKGLLKDSALWEEQIKRRTAALQAEKEGIIQLMEHQSLRSVLYYARIGLMLGDYYVSSQPDEERAWQTDLYANTNHASRELKQKLDEHLVRVAAQTSKIVRSLPGIMNKMECAYDVRTLHKKSPAAFAWQDRAVEKIKDFRKAQESGKTACGWFIVNMASTGCGKTLANAKIMQAISADGESLRYALALGLRSLTLQTGDEYRRRIGLSKDELAVLIGSAALRQLHEEDTQAEEKRNSSDEFVQESLLNGELEYSDTYEDGFLDLFFDAKNNPAAGKNKAFLYKPVLVATIDHLMPAVETIRGGRHLLPFLRMMSSDLVIDEIDDFDKRDLMAISRLVHLAGMLGRNAAISSATIPPDLAMGLFRAYQSGRRCYRDFFQVKEYTACVWCDEFRAKVEAVRGNELAAADAVYHTCHQAFVKYRVQQIAQQLVKRKAYLVGCAELMSEKAALTFVQKREQYFAKICKTAESLHDAHGIIDPLSGKKISFGLIRVAHVNSCAALGKFLLEAEWTADYSPKIMIYHSRQTLLLRHEQEKYLDRVLKRKGEAMDCVNIKDDVIRRHIESAKENNLLFLVIATPVEEIGRDHDFDWAIVEPSSYRSLIQLVGRILRHRMLTADILKPNVAVMQYNLNSLRDDRRPVFCRPGYEAAGKYKLPCHDMACLVDEKRLAAGVDAIPRISAVSSKEKDKEKLLALEHLVMHDFQDMLPKGPETMHGWLCEYWWLTGLPQQCNRFRKSEPESRLYRIYNAEDALRDREPLKFYEKDDRSGELVPCEEFYTIEKVDMDAAAEHRFWLQRDYIDALRRRAAEQNESEMEEEARMEEASRKFGEISIPADQQKDRLRYSDQFGLFSEER